MYSNNPKIWLIWIFHREMCPNDADGMTNSIDPDQIARIWVYTVCSDLCVWKFRNIMVVSTYWGISPTDNKVMEREWNLSL